MHFVPRGVAIVFLIMQIIVFVNGSTDEFIVDRTALGWSILLNVALIIIPSIVRSTKNNTEEEDE